MTGGAADRGYLRFPTIAGDTVVFTCDDDLWSVSAHGGAGHRLTAGVAEASRPRLSADGTLVAFVGAEDGPTEIYLLPPAGGCARRLTFQAARCTTVGWHPHTGEIIYASTAEQPAGFGPRLFAVAPDGGLPRELGYGPAEAIAFGPDGSVVLGRNTADPARWKRYRGGGAGELWIAPGTDGPFRRLVQLPGNLANPCWAGGRIYFIADHEGIGNVYSVRPDGGGLTRHTDHRDRYARNLSTDGRRLVYHAAAELYLIDPCANGSAPSCSDDGAGRIAVTTGGARSQRGRRFVSAAEFLTEAQPSPDGTRLALLTRGRVLTLAHWSGPVRGHGRPDGVRYRQLHWLADGRRLVAVAADAEPDERLVLLDAGGGPAEHPLATGDIGCVTELLAAPAGGTVAFATNRQQLWAADADTPHAPPRLLDSCPAERIEDLAFSPDGRWLAYTFPESPRTSAIRLAEIATGRVHRITEPVLRDTRPEFDPGGRYLYFLGQRELTPDADQVQFDIGFPFGCRPYLVTLRAEDASPFVPVPVVPGRAPAGPPGGGAEPVRIDLAGIDRRVVPFPVPEGRYAGIAGLPGKVLLHSAPVAAPDPDNPGERPSGGVTLVDLRTGEVTEDHLRPVDELCTGAAGELLVYRCGERLRVLPAAGIADLPDEHAAPDAPAGPASGWIDLDRIVLPLDPVAEWRQMTRETWRLQRETFWDAAMSGVDWTAVHDRYAPLVERIGTRGELSDLLWELQAELATSHAYERGGEYRARPRHEQGFLGVDLTDTGDPAARWRIERVLHGDPWQESATSPCNRPGTDVRPGDAILAIDGRPVGAAGPGELLVGRAGQEVELTLLRPGAGPHAVTVRATGSETRARYRDWVRANTEHVHTASAGRLGYLHVPDMQHTGYAEFVRGFLAELDREALVVDVRFNGGGHISPLLLDRLTRRRAGAEHGRWSGVAPYPGEAPRGPMVALVNEHTGSDGEIFAHVFRTLGLGRLIGRRTWGGVIATWPRHELVDGTTTTQPEFRYYLRNVGDLLENRGVEPDVEIVPPPGRTAGDPHLAAAVTHLLAELDGTDDGPPVPLTTPRLPRLTLPQPR